MAKSKASWCTDRKEKADIEQFKRFRLDTYMY